MGTFRFIILTLFAGCSASLTEYSPCEIPAECRDAYGFGWTCGEDGYCDELQPHARCTDTYPQDLFERKSAYKDYIVLGTLMNHVSSRPYVDAVELTAFLVSDDLTVGPFAMIHCQTEEDLSLDGLTGDEAIQSPALWLADTVGVPAIVGPDFSSTTLTAFEVLDETNVFMMSPSATAEELITMDGETKSDESPGQFWRTAPPDSLQAKVIAQDMASRGLSNVAVIHTDGSYGNGLAASFSEHFTGTLLARSFSTDSERDDAIFEVGADAAIEEVLFIAPAVSDSVALLASAHTDPNYKTKTLFLTDGGAQQLLLTDSVDYVAVYDRVRGTRPAAPSGVLWGYFVTSYLNRYGENPLNDAFSAYAHDAGWLTLYAAAAAEFQDGAVTGLGMSRAMRKMSDGAEVPLRRGLWETGLDILAQEGRMDVVGSSGALDFDPATEETFAPIDVWVISDEEGDWRLLTEYTVTE